MELDAVLLSRLQFAFTVGFHILFPTLTIGLALSLVGWEAAWLRTRNALYLELYRFWVRIFALTFGMGVVSGIVLSYQFGTNFSRFSDITGPVLGPLLSAEVLTAFFVEAGFLGIMLFGWDKVGPRLHFVATCLVALGTLNSSFWILAANSWMQTPAGAVFEGGRFVVESWYAVVFNPSTLYRVAHMVLASFVTTSLVVAGVSAWHVLKRRGGESPRRALSAALVALAVLAPAQVAVGDRHGLQVFRDQPVKVAAMEGLWETTRGAPFLIAAWPDTARETNRFELRIPHLASLILTHEWEGEVTGLTSVPPSERPPVAIVFWAFRVMVGLGFLFVAIGLYGAVALWRRRLFDDRRFLRLCVLALPLGFVATLAGWVVAEVGRQPYTVYGLLRTADSVSPIAASTVASSLTAFVLVYGVLFWAYLYYVAKLVRIGPAVPVRPIEAPPEAMRGARAATVLPADEETSP